MKTGVVNNNNFHGNKLRIDPSFHLSEGQLINQIIARSPYGISTIGSASNKIFYGNRAKRIYVSKKENGIPFLSSSDILLEDIEKVKLVSKKHTLGIEEMGLEEGWTLITRSGTIGNCAYVDKRFIGKLSSEHVMRVCPNNKFKKGLLFAYLASKFGHCLLTQGSFGAVIQHIEPDFVSNLPIPNFPSFFQKEVDDLIQQSAKLREEATNILFQVQKELKELAKLPELTTEDYDFYGVSTKGRRPSIFIRNKKDITTTSINAFNHSLRIRNLKAKISMPFVPLRDILANGDVFTTGSFSRIEAPEGKGVMLINQSDIFDCTIKGKNIYKKCLKNVKLVDYGEVMIAGVGTLGENELFCRCIFANENLKGQLVSGEFLRMKTINSIPSGYLFAWLSSDYGFRMIRSTQSGTKQCRPIQKLLLDIPVPILSLKDMQSIDEKVKTAHTLRYKATINENKAITMVEEEIEKWQSPTA